MSELSVWPTRAQLRPGESRELVIRASGPGPVSIPVIDGVSLMAESEVLVDGGASAVTVPLPAVARLAAGLLRLDNHLVFAGPTGGPIPPGSVTRRFQALLAGAGVGRLRFHDLRHAAATVLLAQAIELRVILRDARAYLARDDGRRLRRCGSCARTRGRGASG